MRPFHERVLGVGKDFGKVVKENVKDRFVTPSWQTKKGEK